MRLFRILAAAAGAAVVTFGQAPAAPKIPDFTPPTPLFRAVLQNNTAEAKRLLEAGADANEEKFFGFAPVFFPVMHQNAELLREMIKHGADVKALDRAGSTTLMWAAFDEQGRPEMIDGLLKLGVDPEAKNQMGETALMWAMRRGDTPAVAALRKAGATDAGIVRPAVEKAIALLQKSAPQFVKVSGCASCHHQSLPQLANGAARKHGFTVDEDAARFQVKTVVAMYKPLTAAQMQKLPNIPITVGYALAGLAAEGYPADEMTALMAKTVASRQAPDGSFPVLSGRPPMEHSVFTAAALAVRSMQVYGKNQQAAVAKAAAWLASAQPANNEDRTMQLLGLTWANASLEEIRKSARALIAAQQPDGGWCQLPNLQTDAYATGQALVALRLSGQTQAYDPAYRRGVGFLLRTQFPDGSWLVRTRTFPFQPYSESGFPHGKDQWVSAAGTSWASMALSLTGPVAGRQLTKLD